MLVYILPTVKEGSILYKPDLSLSWIIYLGFIFAYFMYRISNGEKAEILKMFVSTLVSWSVILLLVGQFIKLEFNEGSYRMRSLYWERTVPSTENAKLVLLEKRTGRSDRKYLTLDLEFPRTDEQFNIKIFTSLFFGDIRDICIEQKKLLESVGIRVRVFCTPKD